MMKYLTIAVLSLAILAGSHQISRVERDRSLVCMYNESGKKYQTLSANSVGDVIVLAGKGHEDYQVLPNNVHIHMDEREIVADCLTKL